MIAWKPGRPVQLPPVDTAPAPLGSWHLLLTEHTGMGGVGARMWLYARIAEHKAARYADGMLNPRWAPAGQPGPDPECWLSPRDVAAWLTAAGYLVAHAAETAPAKPRRPGRDSLAVLIEREQRMCADPRSIAELWGRMLALVDTVPPPHPLIARDGKAFMYRSDASEEVKRMTRDALGKRLKPRPPRRK